MSIKNKHACFVLLTGNISVSITSIHAHNEKYILCISDNNMYPGMHRSLAYRSRSPEQAYLHTFTTSSTAFCATTMN